MRPAAGRVAATVVFAAMAVAIVALSVSNLMLRKRLGEARRGVPAPESFRVGEPLPQFAALDRLSQPVRLGGRTGAERLFVFFLPGCNPCEEALAQIAAQPSPDLAVVSVLSPKLSESEVARLPRSVPVYYVDDWKRSPIRNKARVVPQIFRVDGQGIITAVCPSYASCLK